MKYVSLFILFLVSVRCVAAAAENEIEEVDLTQWTQDGCSYNATTGQLTFQGAWQSFRYNFGSRTTGPAGRYYKVVLELQEALDYDYINLWTAVSDPNVDRTDHVLAKGSTIYTVILPEDHVSQIGITEQDDAQIANGANIKIKRLYFVKYDETETNFIVSDLTSVENNGNVTANPLGGYAITGYGWVGYQFTKSYGYNDFSTLRISFGTATSAPLYVSLVQDGESRYDGTGTYMYTVPAGTVGDYDITIKRKFNEIAIANAGGQTYNFDITGISLVRQIFTYDIIDGNASVTGCKIATGKLEIPAQATVAGDTYNVTSIADRAFYMYEYVDSFILPNSITSIGREAFAHCWMQDIVIPESVSEIGVEAFWNCHQLESVTFNTKEKELFIGARAFGLCRSLSTIRLPEGLVSVEDQLFEGCDALSEVWLNYDRHEDYEPLSEDVNWQWYNLTPTGIKSVEDYSNEKQEHINGLSNSTYNLAGQKVDMGYKGIVIINGKKFFKSDY